MFVVTASKARNKKYIRDELQHVDNYPIYLKIRIKKNLLCDDILSEGT